MVEWLWRRRSGLTGTSMPGPRDVPSQIGRRFPPCQTPGASGIEETRGGRADAVAVDLDRRRP